MVDNTMLMQNRKQISTLVEGNYDVLWKSIEKAIQTQIYKDAHAAQSFLLIH